MNKTIIWDFNGTVLDDFRLCLDIINAMLNKRKLPVLSAGDYLDHFDFPVIDYYQKVGFDFSMEPFHELATEYMASYQPKSFDCQLRQGLLPTLDALKKAGFRQILLSATQRDFLIEQVGHFKLLAYFDQIVGLDDIQGRSKLEAARIWQVQEAAEGGNLILVGDTTHDFAVARALDCACLLLEGGHNSGGRLRATGSRVVREAAEIIGFLA